MLIRSQEGPADIQRYNPRYTIEKTARETDDKSNRRKADMTEKIRFIPDGEEEAVDFFVAARGKLAGTNYLLVTDEEEGDGEALILREIFEGAGEEPVYVIVEDDRELAAVCALMRDDLAELGILLET